MREALWFKDRVIDASHNSAIGVLENRDYPEALVTYIHADKVRFIKRFKDRPNGLYNVTFSKLVYKEKRFRWKLWRRKNIKNVEPKNVGEKIITLGKFNNPGEAIDTGLTIFEQRRNNG